MQAPQAERSPDGSQHRPPARVQTIFTVTRDSRPARLAGPTFGPSTLRVRATEKMLAWSVQHLAERDVYGKSRSARGTYLGRPWDDEIGGLLFSPVNGWHRLCQCTRMSHPNPKKPRESAITRQSQCHACATNSTNDRQASSGSITGGLLRRRRTHHLIPAKRGSQPRNFTSALCLTDSRTAAILPVRSVHYAANVARVTNGSSDSSAESSNRNGIWCSTVNYPSVRAVVTPIAYPEEVAS